MNSMRLFTTVLFMFMLIFVTESWQRRGYARQRAIGSRDFASVQPIARWFAGLRAFSVATAEAFAVVVIAPATVN
ncbi:hypothetical protein CASFOL_020489 [Castilleja foliolosa]|uniref:Uncharacterized protein n=1 Tax=Castilleja foliolosa TaxID=1961234 RepID=A0ABD3D593_9LAMI